MTLPPLEEFLANEAFTLLDRQFARQISAWAAPQSTLAGHAGALASLMLRQRHLCIALDRPPDMLENGAALVAGWPGVAQWRADLLSSGVVATDEHSFLPLVLTATDQLYLHRYAEYEAQLAAALLARLDSKTFRVIVGGPGTGKTYTILQTLIDRITANPALRIALAAPTGKAAQRMEESIRKGLAETPLEARIRARLPTTASTLHRLLGTRGDSTFYRHDAANPLPLDLLIIDEASMVDLPMMAKLLAALAPQTELMLVGDPDQLASVEVGAVLADIVTAAERNPTLASASQRLRTQHRYGAESGIGRLCEAIRHGDHAAALATLEENRFADIRLRPLPLRESLATRLRETVTFRGLRAALENRDPTARLTGFSRARILSPLRKGPWGIEGLNAAVEELLHEAGVIDANQFWYDGRPVLVVRNDYAVRLFNGDTGVVVMARDHGPNTVVFPGETDQPRVIAAARLPEHQTNFAMTVHRSQGSEFDHVLIVLPPADHRLLNRELLYTAVSRARSTVEIWGDADTLRHALERRASRNSGLAQRLTPQSCSTAHAG